MYLSLLLGLGCCVIIGCGGGDSGKSQKQVADETAAEGQSADAPGAPEAAVAEVNGEPITARDFAARLHRAFDTLDMAAPPDEYTLNRLREEVLTEMVESLLIAQKAEEQGFTVTEEEFRERVEQVQDEYNGEEIHEILEAQGKSYEAWAQAQRETILANKLVSLNMESMITVSDEEVQQYYERNQEKYDHPAQVRASQILTYDEETARKALQDIQAGTPFEEVARKYSESQDAQNGGDLGFFAGGVMPPEFDEVTFSLEMGEVSDVVKTPYGYQIFKLTDRREAHRVSFEEAQNQIRTMLQKQKRMFAFDLWIAELRKNSDIVLHQDVLKQIK